MTVRRSCTLLTFGEDSYPDGWGDVVQFAPDSLYRDDDATPALLVQHNAAGPAAGRAVATWLEGDTVRATFETLDTPAGAQLEAEWRAGVREDVSVGVYVEEYTAEPLDADDDDPWAPHRMIVQLADLAEGSACLRGRFPSAKFDPLDPDGAEANTGGTPL